MRQTLRQAFKKVASESVWRVWPAPLLPKTYGCLSGRQETANALFKMWLRL